MEVIARLRENVNGATPGAATSSSATRELAIDWFWALAAFGLGLAMFASGGLGPAEPDQNASGTPKRRARPREQTSPGSPEAGRVFSRYGFTPAR